MTEANSGKTIFDMLAQPSPPAPPVLTMPMVFAERIESLLSDLALYSSEYVELRAMINAPLPELWAIHIVGPDQEHPMFSREHAEQQAKYTTERCAELMPSIPVTVNVIPSPFEPLEHFQLLAEALMEEEKRLRYGWKLANEQADGLRAFANTLVTAALEGGDADGAYMQELAVKHGLIKKVTAHRPCVEPDDEKRFCACAQSCGVWPVECYQRTEVLTAGKTNNDKSEG